ncbi:MAG: glycosyltransferase, partial [Anaerolineales bacterium]|nr:glycosyltransferase [Anaerolineales bacterium]
MNSKPIFDEAGAEYQRVRMAQWDGNAVKRDTWKGMGGWYHKRVTEYFKFLVNPKQRILEIGCGLGDLLASLDPSRGVGVDFSAEAVTRAEKRHPHLEFHQLDAHDLSSLEGEFDIIIFSDAINDLWDVQRALEQVRRFCVPRTRLILNFYSHLWQIPLSIAQSLNLATPILAQNWLTVPDVNNLLNLAGFETIRNSNEILFPLPLGGFANRYLARLWPLREFALSNFLIARPAPKPVENTPSVSVVVAARNEEGNVKNIFERVPLMGSKTELIFVEGHSRDKTYETIEKEMPLHPRTSNLLFRQPGIGKADAIRLGFEKASGDILMILDADLTVPPEDLPRFYEAIASGRGEFINGVRLVYPMEKEAMRTLNFIGNKFFSMAFSWLLGQSVKDTLCGTKVMWRKDYEAIAANRAYFGDFDPFGDFDLIFGAAKLNLKIVDLPIRYR